MPKKRKYDNCIKPEMPEVCAYCEKSTPLMGGEKMLCSKNGVVSPSYRCRRFCYDPLKRVPTAPPKIELLDSEDILV
jgi:hypothetical protein